MAVRAADLTACDLVAETLQARFPPHELRDRRGLLADVIEVQYADIRLAAVDAAGGGQRFECGSQIARVRLGPRRAVAAVGLQPTPAPATRSAATMAVRTHDLAARDLREEDRLAHAPPYERGYVRTLRSHMIELEHDRVHLPAVEARVRSEIGKYERLRGLHTDGLQCVVATPVVGAALGVVRLEAVPTPPLPACGMSVEAARRTGGRTA